MTHDNRLIPVILGVACTLLLGVTLNGCILFEDPSAIEGVDVSVSPSDTHTSPDGTDVSDCSDSNPLSCGAACLDCSALDFVAEATCNGGTCAIVSCEANFLDCNSLTSDGCEQPETDQLCGPSCTSCRDRDNSLTGTCNAGVCDLACEAGWTNCDGNEQNGCEKQESEAACGASCLDCGSLDNVDTANCTGGTCRIQSCAWGWLDCNADPADGCEAQFADNACGAGCALDCTALTGVGVAHCAGATCGVVSCGPGYLDENNDPSDGCEKACALGECWSEAMRPVSMAVFLEDSLYGLASTVGGDLYYTEDGGLTWDLRVLPNDQVIGSIAYADEHVVYAVNQLGDVFKSEDIGLTWDKLILPASLPKPQAVVADGELIFLFAANALVRSQNGGQTWDDLSNSVTASNTTAALVNGNFLMLASANGQILWTNDRGVTFFPGGSPAAGAVNALVADDATIYALTSSAVFATTDSGISWAAVTGIPTASTGWASLDVEGEAMLLAGAGSPFFGFRSLNDEPGLTGTIAGGNSLVGGRLDGANAVLLGSGSGFGLIYEGHIETADGGTMTAESTLLSAAYNGGPEMLWVAEEGTTLFAGGGANGLLLRSDDDGAQWVALEPPSTRPLLYPAMPGLTEGLLVADHSDILFTADGQDFRLEPLSGDFFYNDAVYSPGSDAFGIIAGSRSGQPTLFRGVLNAGGSINWDLIDCVGNCGLSKPLATLTNVVVSGGNLIVTTSEGEVVLSPDKGVSWANLAGALGGAITHVVYNAPTIVVLVSGVGSRIYYSNNDGQGWPDTLGLPTAVWDGQANSEVINDWAWDGSVGVAVGNNLMLKTIDGGASWAPVPAEITTALDFVAIDADRIIAGNASGTILFSADGGQSVGETVVNLRGRSPADITIDGDRALIVSAAGQVLMSYEAP